MPRGREATRITVEACIRIDLAEPSVRATLSPGLVRFGTWRWSRSERTVAELGYEWRADRQELTLRYRVGGVDVVDRIATETTRPRFGGARLWFVCPATGRRTRTLFLPPGARFFRSRSAYRLVYQSTRDSGLGRALLRVFARIEADPARGAHWRAMAAAPGDPLGLLAEKREAKRAEGRVRRNAVRRIRRGERG
jgi:hypothetical protein